jgi:putative transcriptional regulator
MIKHHPNKELLVNFVAGDVPAGIAAAIAIHNQMCPKCQKIVAEITELQAEEALESVALEEGNDELTFDFDSMIDSITEFSDIELPPSSKEINIEVKGQKYTLPKALTNLPMGSWNGVGSLARARFALDEGEIHSSLLQIEAGGSVPAHTHKGFEITVLLDGSFEDEMGRYTKGDFLMLDSNHNHTPFTENGCLCYTVSNAPLHFTQGFNKLLNPIGSLIY